METRIFSETWLLSDTEVGLQPNFFQANADQNRESPKWETWVSSDTEVGLPQPKISEANADQDREPPKWVPPMSSLISDTNDEVVPGSTPPFSSYYEEAGKWSIHQAHTGKLKPRRLKLVLLLAPSFDFFPYQIPTTCSASKKKL